MISEEEIQQVQRIAGWLNRTYWNEDMLGHLYEVLLRIKLQGDPSKRDNLAYQRNCLIWAGRRHAQRDRLLPSRFPVVSIEQDLELADQRVYDFSKLDVQSLRLTEADMEIVNILSDGHTQEECSKMLGITRRVLVRRIMHIRKKLR